jgi:hypothetical protein
MVGLHWIMDRMVIGSDIELWEPPKGDRGKDDKDQA